MLEYFLDENLSGKTFAVLLHEAGIPFVTSQDLGFRATPDHIWIPHMDSAGDSCWAGDSFDR